MRRTTRWSLGLAGTVTALVGAAGAYSHPPAGADPSLIHACVNRVGEVRILGYMGYPGGVEGPCPSLGAPWANVHWAIAGRRRDRRDRC